MKVDATEPEAAAHFLLSQAEPGPVGADARSELLDVRERCLLLVLAAHWLSLPRPAPVERLESLEKSLWTSRIRQHVVMTTMEQESVFGLPPPSVTPGMNVYEALMKEFSFANISQLNTDACLRLDHLPGPNEGEGPGEPLSPEGRSLLQALIGQLLDDGSVHEAARVCRYFSLFHADLWVVLRCRGLASGQLDPDRPEGALSGDGPQVVSCK